MCVCVNTMCVWVAHEARRRYWIPRSCSCRWLWPIWCEFWEPSVGEGRWWGSDPQPQTRPTPSPLPTFTTQTHELLARDELLERPLDEDVVKPDDAPLPLWKKGQPLASSQAANLFLDGGSSRRGTRYCPYSPHSHPDHNHRAWQNWSIFADVWAKF